MENEIKVSVYCLAYNHEKYIRDALEGFVNQVTDFKYEVFVHDDASTDNTAKIIAEYAGKYSNIIKPIYQTENQYSKGIKILNSFIWPHMKGKYVAMCEGDDYWIDPLKLQKQVDFMESHQEVSEVFSRCHVLRGNEYIDDEYPAFKGINDCFFTAEQLYKNWVVPTASMLYRKDQCVLYNDKRIYAGDIVRNLSMAEQGKVYGMSDYMTVYRLNINGLTISRLKNEVELNKRYIEHVNFLRETFHSVPSKLYDKKEMLYRYGYVIAKYKADGKLDIRNLIKAFRLCPFVFIKRLMRDILHKMKEATFAR